MAETMQDTQNPSEELSDSVLANLRNLIELNLEGHAGYMNAAESLENPDYQVRLREFAADRQRFAAELRDVIRQYAPARGNEELEPGAIDSGWGGLASVLGGGDRAILEQCAAADQVAVVAYQDTIAKVLPESILEVLRQQFTDVRNAYEWVHGLSAAMAQAESHQ